jgi:nucleotidyltransferase/DNA polymerase involved in DNA repair
MARIIFHVDMDCFYAAVEVRDNPGLRGKPVIVGADPSGRGVVSAASYEARKYGIHSAMPISRAKKRCPHAVFLPVDMEKYAAASTEVMATLSKYTDLLEQVSVDEAFMDMTGTGRLFGPPEQAARAVKSAVLKALKLTASIGVAPNKYLAKIASDLRKPDGLVIVAPDKVAAFLGPLPVSRIWGVGKQNEKALHRLGIRTIGQLADYPFEGLTVKFGEETARHFKDLAQGIDDRPVEPYDETKSISHEHTFQHDVSDRGVLRKALLDMADRVMARLRRQGLKCRTVFLTFRTTNFDRHTRNATLPAPTDVSNEVFRRIEALFKAETFYGLPVRLIGAGVMNLTGTEQEEQMDMFSKEDKGKQKSVDGARDKIIEKYGDDAVRRASLL